MLFSTTAQELALVLLSSCALFIFVSLIVYVNCKVDTVLLFDLFYVLLYYHILLSRLGNNFGKSFMFGCNKIACIWCYNTCWWRDFSVFPRSWIKKLDAKYFYAFRFWYTNVLNCKHSKTKKQQNTTYARPIFACKGGPSKSNSCPESLFVPCSISKCIFAGVRKAGFLLLRDFLISKLLDFLYTTNM